MLNPITPRIETLTAKKLVGMKMSISLANYAIAELWKNFMPRRKDIANNLTNELISLAIYKPTHFTDFKPTNEFTRWATIEVADFENVPFGLETFILDGGLYAVFDYKGLSTDKSVYQYIFGTWLPNSEYILDDRPHFEILGDKYKSNDPNSEEELWIPIKPK
jgi:AraC family transcriptional regulator